VPDACGQGRNVRAVLTRNPITVLPSINLGAAWDLMKQNHFRHLPVVDDKGDLVGILSDRDILGVLGVNHAGEHTVGEVMQTEVDVVSPGCCMDAAARFILRSRHSCLPVVEEDGRVVGIITEADFLIYLVQDSWACACEPWKVLSA
jgi:CBS domain-containing protein